MTYTPAQLEVLIDAMVDEVLRRIDLDEAAALRDAADPGVEIDDPPGGAT